MEHIVHNVLRFDRFTLDLTRGCLRHADRDIALRPKAFELLRHLAENAGRLVPKDELCRAVWPGVFVSDDSLVQCIRELRDKLDDHSHRLIKTMPRRGYLLDAQVEPLFLGPAALRPDQAIGTGPADSAAEAPGRDPIAAASPGRWWPLRRPARSQVIGSLVLVSAALIAGATIWATIGPRPTAQPTVAAAAHAVPRLSLAVLPFQNLGADLEQNNVASSITDDLITGLSRFYGGLSIARSVAFTPTEAPIDVRKVGRELGVRYVVEGTIRRSGDQLRVTARLIDASTAANIWTESFDTELRGISELRDEVTMRLSRSFVVELFHAERARSIRERPDNPDATDYLIRASTLLHDTPDGGDLSEPRRLFREALRLDGSLPGAWMGVASSYLRRIRFSPTREQDLQEASEAAERAVTLKPMAAGPHVTRGWVRYEQKRMGDALMDFEHAMQLDPRNPEVLASIAAANIMLGRPENALESLRKAMRLSPTDRHLPRWQLIMGVARLHLGHDDEAVEWLRRSAALNAQDQFTQLFLASALARIGREAEARAAVANLLQLAPGFSLSRFRSLEPSDAPAFLAQRERVYDGLRRAGLPD
ncbi:winged helix-turn-helix domain-containing tetratricopeptide repeat protein [Phreatobacter stygius]|nr:winged helix-turn-helix domain-containing protein [Phreatobacter stygius]